jgi:thymidylate synthase
VSTLLIPNLRHGYLDIIKHVAKRGTPVAPRGQKTTEVLDAVIILEDPADALPVGIGRQLNLAIAAAEAIQLVAGVSLPSMLFKIQPAFRKYAEDDGHFHAPYGRRIGHQVTTCVNKLRADKDTRQAIITLWNPLLDWTTHKRDYPCTVMLQFLIRNDKLILHTTMRSNDVWLGVAYDLFQFTQLQLTVARVLGIEVGPYHHHAVSLHIYDRDWESIEELHAPDSVLPSYPVGFGRPGDTWPTASIRANSILGQCRVEEGVFTQSELWYAEQLQDYLG